jgi:hypothetical protein
MRLSNDGSSEPQRPEVTVYQYLVDSAACVALIAANNQIVMSETPTLMPLTASDRCASARPDN